MFNKPVSQLNESDIQELVNNSEKESLILEYKQEVLGTDHEKKEISKDVSAMANTDGGYLIIGVEEEDSKAKSIYGTQMKIGNQPVEEWLENVLITNIRPRISIKPKVISIASKPDKIIIVLYIPQSSRKPHMIITDGKNAYYKRHNYLSTYADEHEVRSMFLESKSSEDEMESFLADRNINISLADNNFGVNPTSKLLQKTLVELREIPTNFGGQPFVLFSTCPKYLQERVDIASADFRSWLDSNNTINFQELNVDFLDYEKTVSANSVRSSKKTLDDKQLPLNYLEIFRNGYLENGIGPEIIWFRENIGMMFQLTWFTASFCMFLKFAQIFYEKIDYTDEITIIVSLASVENITLHGFGKKNDREVWSEPHRSDPRFYKLPTCKEKNVRIERSVLASELDSQNIESIVKDISKRASNAFGESISKCFDDDGNFNKNGLRGFRNIR